MRPSGADATSDPVDPLPPAFYDRDALEVARDLVGCEVALGEVRLRLVEVEAYRFPGDTANHARAGRTARNWPMWGPPGRAYVYLCYGLHQMLNFVTGPEGHAAAVLVRGAEPIAGLETIRERRGGRDTLDGPGKVAAALGLDVTWSGARLDDRLRVYARTGPVTLLHGPRVGIDYAMPEDRAAPWRVALAGSRQVGHRRSLR